MGTKPCDDLTPRWFAGHWRDWHRGHGCDKDDGKPLSDATQSGAKPNTKESR